MVVYTLRSCVEQLSNELENKPIHEVLSVLNMYALSRIEYKLDRYGKHVLYCSNGGALRVCVRLLSPSDCFDAGAYVDWYEG